MVIEPFPLLLVKFVSHNKRIYGTRTLLLLRNLSVFSLERTNFSSFISMFTDYIPNIMSVLRLTHFEPRNIIYHENLD